MKFSSLKRSELAVIDINTSAEKITVSMDNTKIELNAEKLNHLGVSNVISTNLYQKQEIPDKYEQRCIIVNRKRRFLKSII